MKIGISACLLGDKCRYDGGHKRDRFITDELSEYFDFSSFCPESLVFGTPREPIRLVMKDDSIHVQRVKTKQDVTNILQDISVSLVSKMKNEEFCGFILKSKSPTCGLKKVKVYQEDGMQVEGGGIGLFAQELQKRFPSIPIEEEGRLKDAWLRENYLMQVFAYKDIHEFLHLHPSYKELVSFHASYKYLIYSKSHILYKKLGQIVANHEKKEISTVLDEYKKNFLEAIAKKSSRAKTYNVLLHIYGYFKKLISQEEKKEILTSLQEFKQGIIPLIAVMKIFNLYAKKFDQKYIKNQKFLHPYPKELALRSHIKAYK